MELEDVAVLHRVMALHHQSVAPARLTEQPRVAQVLGEIAAMLDDSRGFAELMRETIRIKCGFVLRAAAKAGLMS